MLMVQRKQELQSFITLFGRMAGRKARCLLSPSLRHQRKMMVKPLADGILQGDCMHAVYQVCPDCECGKHSDKGYQLLLGEHQQPHCSVCAWHRAGGKRQQETQVRSVWKPAAKSSALSHEEQISLLEHKEKPVSSLTPHSWKKSRMACEWIYR